MPGPVPVSRASLLITCFEYWWEVEWGYVAETDLGSSSELMCCWGFRTGFTNESGNSLFLLCICSELLLWVQDKAYEIRVVSRTVPLMTGSP